MSYGAIRYLACRMFAHPSIHRGIFHSLVVALFFCFLATSLSFSVFDIKALFAWSIGCFILFGYILHLLLDELFRVDFLITRLKSSFGTTLKIADFNDARTSTMMTAATLLAFFMPPRTQPCTAWIMNNQTYLNVANHFLPETMWFSL